MNSRQPSPTLVPLSKCAVGPNARAKDCSQHESLLRATFQCLTSSLLTLSILVEKSCKVLKVSKGQAAET